MCNRCVRKGQGKGVEFGFKSKSCCCEISARIGTFPMRYPYEPYGTGDVGQNTGMPPLGPNPLQAAALREALAEQLRGGGPEAWAAQLAADPLAARYGQEVRPAATCLIKHYPGQVCV
jgi:hypothetical protein